MAVRWTEGIFGNPKQKSDSLDRLVRLLSEPDLEGIRQSRACDEKLLLLFEKRRGPEQVADPETEQQIAKLKHRLKVQARYEARLLKRAEALRRQANAQQSAVDNVG